MCVCVCVYVCFDMMGKEVRTSLSKGTALCISLSPFVCTCACMCVYVKRWCLPFAFQKERKNKKKWQQQLKKRRIQKNNPCVLLMMDTKKWHMVHSTHPHTHRGE